METDDIQARIERLERENRCMKAAAAVAILLVVGMGAMQITQIQDEVRAKKFVLVDDNGKTRGVIAINDQGPSLTFLDKNGSGRVALGILREEKPYLALADEKEKPRLAMDSDESGTGVRLLDANGRVRSSINARPDGGCLALNDANGKERVNICEANDGAYISLFDGNAKRRVSMLHANRATELQFCGADGKPLNVLANAGKMLLFKLTNSTDTLGNAMSIGRTGWVAYDEANRPRIGLAVSEETSAIWLSDQNGKARASIASEKDHTSVRLHDANGVLRTGLAATPTIAGMSVLDESGKMRGAFGLDSIGSGLRLFDDNGTPRGGLIANKDVSGLVLADARGQFRGGFSLNASGPCIRLLDEGATTRGAFVVQGGEPYLALCNKDGSPIFHAPCYQPRPAAQQASGGQQPTPAPGSPREDLRVEYDAALAAYNAARADLDAALTLAHIGEGVKKNFGQKGPALAKLIMDVAADDMIREKQRKLDIAVEQLERAKANLYNWERRR